MLNMFRCALFLAAFAAASPLFAALVEVAADTSGSRTEEPKTADSIEDYGAALEATRRASRPLLVVLDVPASPASRIEQLAVAEKRQQDDLLPKYTLCHIDVTTPYGQRVAQVFRATTFPTTAIIDKTGSIITFAKKGQFSNDEWRATLARYQTGQRRPLVRREPIVCFT